ncbi:hypothetical protein VARIO8X_150171 [Burkholderiales bacterium 8X]|nr:hypothetical protein VARIO8X_150171 [Burkholderiales bacterium 8X]
MVNPSKGRKAEADGVILGVTLVELHFIFVMFIIHQDDGRQLSHAGSQPPPGVRRGHGGAEPDARCAQPVVDAARRQ